VVKSYRERMREYAEMGHLELWYSRIDEGNILPTLSPKARRRAEKVIAKAKTRTHLQVLDKLTEMVDDQHRIHESKPLIVREQKVMSGRPMAEALALFIRNYLESISDDRQPLLARYKILDVVRKAVGVGSVGTRCWVIFLAGNHDEDPLFLQVKEAEASVLAPYTAPSAYANQGQRVVVGQRLIQGAPDIFLGWGKQEGFHFYVRQLRDMKGSAELAPGEVEIDSFIEQCGLFGWALALAHAKTGDPAMIAGYAGKSETLDEAIARFAFAYADQTERDYETLGKAARTHRIRVVRGH